MSEAIEEKITLDDRETLIEGLHHEAYDVVAIDADGSWYPTTTGTATPDAEIIIKHVNFYNVKRWEAELKADQIECQLKNDGCGEFPCEDHRPEDYHDEWMKKDMEENPDRSPIVEIEDYNGEPGFEMSGKQFKELMLTWCEQYESVRNIGNEEIVSITTDGCSHWYEPLGWREVHDDIEDFMHECANMLGVEVE